MMRRILPLLLLLATPAAAAEESPHAFLTRIYTRIQASNKEALGDHDKMDWSPMDEENGEYFTQAVIAAIKAARQWEADHQDKSDALPGFLPFTQAQDYVDIASFDVKIVKQTPCVARAEVTLHTETSVIRDRFDLEREAAGWRIAELTTLPGGYALYRRLASGPSGAEPLRKPYHAPKSCTKAGLVH